MKIGDIWLCGVIKYLQNKGLAHKDVHADMVARLEAYAPALLTEQKWATEFKRGRLSFEWT